MHFNYSLDLGAYSWKNALFWGNFKGHCKKTREGNFCKRIIHALIAAALFTPIFGQIGAIFEKVIVENFSKKSQKKATGSSAATLKPLFRAQQNGRSQEGCRGGISQEKAKKMWEKLQQRPAEGITFDWSLISKSTTIIGTCTAMSLEFASTYRRLRKELNGVNPASQEFQEKLCSLKEKFEKSSEKMRSRQMAYSSITVDPAANIDVSKNKIESCVRSHDFEIGYSSEEMDIEKKEQWVQEIDNLQPGVYFIRMIKPTLNNHKLEERGHSMIYIHEEDVGYFYDNNVGLEKTPQVDGEKDGHFLYSRLLNLHKTWDIPSMRFYQLESSL